MAIVSTFELLTKTLIPKTFDEVGSGRIIVQGYFFTIANLSDLDVTLNIKFTAATPGFDTSKIAAFFDILGTNNLLAPAVVTPTSITYKIKIPKNDTGLFILQPDVTKRQILIDASDPLKKALEIRGYVDLSLSRTIGSNTYNLLLTPEHRGTFLPKDINIPPKGPITSVTKDFDQLAYALPTAQGKAQYTLKQMSFVPIDLPIVQPVDKPTLETKLQESMTAIWERIEELAEAQKGG
jgi:hypothetical protein